LFGRGFGTTFRLSPRFPFAWGKWPDPNNAHTIHSTPFMVMHMTGVVGVVVLGTFLLRRMWECLILGRGDQQAMLIALIFFIFAFFSPNVLINWMALSFFACGAAKPAGRAAPSLQSNAGAARPIAEGRSSDAPMVRPIRPPDENHHPLRKETSASSMDR